MESSAGSVETTASADESAPPPSAEEAPATAVSPATSPQEPPAPPTAAGVDIAAPAGAPQARPALGDAAPPVRVPASTRLAFDVSGQAKKFAYTARAELLWQHDGSRYEARQEVSAFLVGSRVQRSVGAITAQGLQPERFSDKSRSEQAAHFDQAKGRVTFSANTPDAAIGPGGLVTDGILSESCDASDRSCDDNGKQFKGIFTRYWTDLVDTTRDATYAAFLHRQAESVWTDDRDAANRLGTRWSGSTNDDHPNVFDWRTQASALSALIGDVPTPAPWESLAATMSPAQPVVMTSASGATIVDIDLDVSATGFLPLQTFAAVNVPDGWGVTPRVARLPLWPHGIARPVDGHIPLRLTVPGQATDGHHAITADLTASWLRFQAQADVLVAHAIDFDTGTAAEAPWLFDPDRSQSNGVQNRFADGTAHFTYRFPFPADTRSAEITLTIDAEFLVQASSDNTHWTTVLQEDRPVTDGSNKADRTIDLTPYLGDGTGGARPVYLKVSDAFPNDGWGGRVYHVKADIVH